MDQVKKMLPLHDFEVEKTELLAATLDDRITVERVEDFTTPFFALHQSSPLENIQVVRDRRLGDVEPFADVGNTQLFFHEKLQYPETVSLTHGKKHLTALFSHSP
jgi:hypothetical protein